MLQIGLDMVVATSAPIGHGHVYAPEHYIAAWIAVTDVQNWSPEALARLKEYLAKMARKESGENAPRDSPYVDQGDSVVVQLQSRGSSERAIEVGWRTLSSGRLENRNLYLGIRNADFDFFRTEAHRQKECKLSSTCAVLT